MKIIKALLATTIGCLALVACDQSKPIEMKAIAAVSYSVTEQDKEKVEAATTEAMTIISNHKLIVENFYEKYERCPSNQDLDLPVEVVGFEYIDRLRIADCKISATFKAGEPVPMMLQAYNIDAEMQSTPFGPYWSCLSQLQPEYLPFGCGGEGTEQQNIDAAGEEAMQLLSNQKQMVENFYKENNRCPNNDELNLPTTVDKFDYVDRLRVENCKVTATFKAIEPVPMMMQAYDIWLEMDMTDFGAYWSCGSYLGKEYLPYSCGGDGAEQEMINAAMNEAMAVISR